MNAPDFPTHDDTALRARFERLHQASREHPEVPLEVRDSRLERLARLLRDHADEFARAIDADFGHRSMHETRLLEVFPSLESIRHARKHLPRWMRPQRRAAGRWFLPARVEIRPQPLGLVGVIVPWNYPLQLAASPLCSVLAAGNRAMVKMSEFTPATGELFASLVARYFAPDEVDVVNGDAAVGASFSSLPFDHLLFTGSTSVGRVVMRAAAEHLTPVTLELGGKSPAIVADGYPLAHAAERILVGKLLNAGQTCIAPDYVLVPRGQERAFAEAARQVVRRFHPDLACTPDYSSIINARHFERLQGLLQDAQVQGAELLPLSHAQPDAASRRLPPVAAWRVHDGMRLMQDEIFGPLLPIVPHDGVDDAIAYVNARPRPLALYLFDRDEQRTTRVLERTVSGGACVNDTLLHIAQEELPFGGVGPSGMGHYHGEAGFRAFSHVKGVFRQSRLNAMGWFNPPYGRVFERIVGVLTR